MRKTGQRRLTWEATQGAKRIVLIREGRLVLEGGSGQADLAKRRTRRQTVSTTVGLR